MTEDNRIELNDLLRDRSDGAVSARAQELIEAGGFTPWLDAVPFSGFAAFIGIEEFPVVEYPVEEGTRVDLVYRDGGVTYNALVGENTNDDDQFTHIDELGRYVPADDDEPRRDGFQAFWSEAAEMPALTIAGWRLAVPGAGQLAQGEAEQAHAGKAS